MKPLELTLYPRRGRETYVLSPAQCLGASAVDRISQQKRFTDAELAAEHWRAKWTGLMHESKFHSVLSDKHRAMIATVERFMDLPHYDQEEATA